MNKNKKSFISFCKKRNLLFDESTIDNIENCDKMLIKLYSNNTKDIIKYRKPKSLEELFDIFLKLSFANLNSLEKYQLKYGEEYGAKLFEEYRKRQAYTNSFEYKREKYGWSEEYFIEYNKSRAITLENLQKKYGNDDGIRRYKEYCDKQAYTNSEEYLGSEKYHRVNKQKAITLENFVRKYGEEIGKQKLEDYYNKQHQFYSKMSQDLFHQLKYRFPFYNMDLYFAEHNKEYLVLSPLGSYYKYDFVCPKLKLCIEFHGDHYHGNPKLYKPDDFLKGRGQTKTKAKEQWEKDKIKQNTLFNQRGIKTIEVWEYDWINDPNLVINEIVKYAKNIIF